MQRADVITDGWEQYELLDSGDGRKLERFGPIILDRPDPQSLWRKTDGHAWALANAHFAWKESGEKWSVNKGVPEEWPLAYGDIALSLSFSKFKHIGVFPEHEGQWSELKELCERQRGARVLNLFGYTGAASLVAAKAGARVTHVDASKQTIGTVKENIARSGLPDDAMRLICEDALKYAKRLVQRGETFEIVIMDPPAFGRGPKGEIWKIEEKLPELAALIPKLLSEHARLVILNGYAAGYSARSFGEFLDDTMKEKKGEISYGDVGIKQKKSDRVLSAGIYAKWQA